MDLINTIKTIKIRNNLVRFDKKKIMGILNLTPDSFYAGSRLVNMADILRKVEQMVGAGADMIDIGGYSSRPGAQDISVEEELKRIIQPVREIRKNFPETIISVDTFRAEVAEKAINAGADIINDITAGGTSEKMFKIIAKYKVPYIIMHMKGSPKTMQKNAVYENVTKEILLFFAEKTTWLKQMGIADIIIDPGFGFGKTISHNFELLRNLNLFRTFNLPVMAGLSRKSMIYRTLDTTPENALNGTTVLNTLSLLNGADIIRVHDVKEAKETIVLLNKYLEAQEAKSG